ncbi:MAG: RnfABCDGE type electron transport complex subunit D, partial [Candidatus Thiodiazotropha sp.]
MIEVQPVAGPYTHARTSISRTMGLVMLALLPASLYSLYLFGWPAIFLFITTLIACLLFEATSLRIA